MVSGRRELGRGGVTESLRYPRSQWYLIVFLGLRDTRFLFLSNCNFALLVARRLV
uniref:Uncharacterized protein n=1 Tax=Anguilla anguilla TaxID=7936 RepID=A0A0E9UEI5_ANGAN